MYFIKAILRVIFVLFTFVVYGQNVLVNGNFQTGSVAPWDGFKNQVVTDNITNSLCGNVDNGDGSLFQVFSVTSGDTYNVVFDYRWVSGTGNYNMTVRVKDGASGGSDLEVFQLDNTPDSWYNGNFSFTVPDGVCTARIIFFKGNGNRPLRIDNVYIASESTTTPSFIDPTTPVNAQPLGIEGDWDLDFSDEFNGTEINPLKWIVSVSNNTRAPRPSLGISEWYWREENAFLNGSGELVLRGTKVNSSVMHCGSVESRNLYEPMFGFLEARIKIAETAKGNHTAFWLQGHNQSVVNNSAANGAEVDIFESAWVNNTTKAVVHFDGYGADRKNHTIPYNTPNLHTGYHVFGLHWTPTAMEIYYDGVLVQSTNANKPFPFTVDPNGYPLVPQVPEWLWLSVGASFADGDFQSRPIGILSDALVDYVRVYKSASTLSADNTMASKAFKFFPNPVRNILNIQSDEVNYSVRIYDIKGRIIKNSDHSMDTKIDLSTFAKGLYIFQVDSSSANAAFRIIVE